MRKRTFAALATSAALVGVAAATPSASAEDNPPGCPKRFFCVYGGINQTGDVWKQEGDWTGVLRTSGSVFNNGKPFPGADHVQLYWTYSGNNWTQCLHYNPGPGTYKINFGDWIVITKIQWRGEC